jgi:hypothetical protein
MGGRAIVAIVLAAVCLSLVPVVPVRAAEYELDSVARYDVHPDERDVAVTVTIGFTNTTPDPDGRFSVFDELRLAIHDEPADVVATDDDGDLDVEVAEAAGVTVATIALREGVRYEESVEVVLTYRIVNGGGDARIGPQLVSFPAWGFGTSSEVGISIPPGFEVRVDGDGLTEGADGTLASGPIDDPTAWLTLVTAIGPAEYTDLDASVTLDGATTGILIRAFADDPEWASSTRDIVVGALPLLERAIGLPYPLAGQLVVTQGVSAGGPAFEPAPSPGEIVVAHDQPPFTLLHQLAHLWIDEPLVESHWIAEGLASDYAARVAGELGIEVPYDPAEEAERLAADAQPLDSWTAMADPARDAYAHARAWQLMAEIREEVGEDAIAAVLARTVASIGPYEGPDTGTPTPSGTTPRHPLTSRNFLDQLGAVSDADLAPRFADVVLSETDAALLPARAEARESFAALLEAADGWGAPDAVRTAMAEWRFDNATPLIDAADAWLTRRDVLVAKMERVGLSRPDRLIQAYRAYGGGPEAGDELEAEMAVVDAYAAAAARVNQPRSVLARLGLVGGADPAAELDRASGLFADGDLRGATVSIEQALRLADTAETSGLVRVASLALLLIGMAAIAVVVFRRRAAYTAAP